MFNEWQPQWPSHDKLLHAMHAPGLYYRPPPALMGLERLHHADVWDLTLHPAWCLWVWNPRLDYIVPPARVKAAHWVNAVLTPLHAPCVGAIRATLPAGHLHRIRCGEAVQSKRPRYMPLTPFEEDDFDFVMW